MCLVKFIVMMIMMMMMMMITVIKRGQQSQKCKDRHLAASDFDISCGKADRQMGVNQ